MKCPATNRNCFYCTSQCAMNFKSPKIPVSYQRLQKPQKPQKEIENGMAKGAPTQET